MTTAPKTNTFVRVNPVVALVGTTTGSATGEVTLGLAGKVPIPPFTAMIRIFAKITSTATAAGSTVFLRDLPGGSDVGLASSAALNVPGGWSGFLDLNGGRVTYSAVPGGATSYDVSIWITGFLRYA